MPIADALEIELRLELDGAGGWRVGVVGRSAVWDVVAPLSDQEVQGLPGVDPSIRTWGSLLERLAAQELCPAPLWLGVGALLRARLLTPRLAAALYGEAQLHRQRRSRPAPLLRLDGSGAAPRAHRASRAVRGGVPRER